MPHKIAGLRWDDCSTLVLWCGYICLSDRCGGFGCVLDESHVASFPQPVFATWTGESVINPEFMIKFYIVISIGESFIKSLSRRKGLYPLRSFGRPLCYQCEFESWWAGDLRTFENTQWRKVILSDITGRTPDLQCRFENHWQARLLRPGGPKV